MEQFQQPRPPIGVKPRWYHAERRLAELAAAITRYDEARRQCPDEWLRELRHLAKVLHKKRSGRPC